MKRETNPNTQKIYTQFSKLSKKKISLITIATDRRKWSTPYSTFPSDRRLQMMAAVSTSSLSKENKSKSIIKEPAVVVPVPPQAHCSTSNNFSKKPYTPKSKYKPASYPYLCHAIANDQRKSSNPSVLDCFISAYSY